ncbi:MAG: uridine kinase [Eubacterium sp.]|nr:uridine kinase [Eubacterium sp.]
MRIGKWEIHNFHKFIFAVFLVKLVLMGIFSSDYQNAMFEKFVYNFFGKLQEHQLINPYNIPENTGGIFPYPPMMFFIECLGGGLSMLFGKNIFISNILFKLPNLFFDCLGLYYLTKLFPDKRKYSAIIYFASPIILYSTYMHGQLDIIPTVLCFGAVYYLTAFRNRSDFKFMLCLFLALSCKLHILAIIPVLFLFIWKRDGWRKAIYLNLMPMIATALLMIPFWSNHFFETVIMNNDQTVLTKVIFSYDSIKIYIPILAVVLVYLKVYTISKINKELLYSLCGILFAVFIVLVPPMPGWYVWSVPYITIFFIDMRSSRYTNLAIYAALNLAYLGYFMFAHQTDFVDLYFMNKSLEGMKVEETLFVNGVFTILTAILIYTIYLMYQSGVASNSMYRRGNLSFTIGISGDSGSGKTTLLELLRRMLGDKNLLYLEGDGDHKWERGNAMWNYFTHLNPKANYIYRQAETLAKLRAGQKVARVDYDHDTGEFTKQHKLSPKPFIVLSGLHALYLPQVRHNLDLKIYMDIEEKLRRYWKIQRDISSRGYSEEQILEQIEERIPDAEKYIYPQKKYADIIFQYFDENLENCLAQNHKVTLSLKVTLNASIELEELIQLIEQYGICVKYDYDDDLERQMVIFTGDRLNVLTMPVERMAEMLIPQLDEIVSVSFGAKNNLEGIVELIVLLAMSTKMREAI